MSVGHLFFSLLISHFISSILPLRSQGEEMVSLLNQVDIPISTPQCWARTTSAACSAVDFKLPNGAVKPTLRHIDPASRVNNDPPRSKRHDSADMANGALQPRHHPRVQTRSRTRRRAGQYNDKAFPPRHIRLHNKHKHDYKMACKPSPGVRNPTRPPPSPRQPRKRIRNNAPLPYNRLFPTNPLLPKLNARHDATMATKRRPRVRHGPRADAAHAGCECGCGCGGGPGRLLPCSCAGPGSQRSRCQPLWCLLFSESCLG